EFSAAFRCIDVASEIAFLAMDLETLERPDLARRFVAAYAAAADDPAVDVLIPFYACYRACVRGKVEGLASIALEVDARTRDTAGLAAPTGCGRPAPDEIRNRGPAPEAAGLYTPAARARVYDALVTEAEAALASGRGVVADATFLRAADRGGLAAAARRERRP